MSKLDAQVYVLKEQRGLPAEQRIRWHYHVATFGDTLACQRESEKEKDEEARDEFFAMARIARCLDRTEGVRRGGELVDLVEDLPLSDRVSWVLRLPAAWVSELALQVAEESDLDPEEESR